MKLPEVQGVLVQQENNMKMLIKNLVTLIVKGNGWFTKTTSLILLKNDLHVFSKLFKRGLYRKCANTLGSISTGKGRSLCDLLSSEFEKTPLNVCGFMWILFPELYLQKPKGKSMYKLWFDINDTKSRIECLERAIELL